jgi:hypothetical protein
MKTSKIIQFVVAGVLFSIGCVSLLAHGLFAISTVCFGLPAVVLMGRAAATRPIPRRELLVGVVFLAVLAAAVIILKLFVSDSVGERAVRHPAFVVPLWVLLMSGLFWRWRRERRLADV